MRSENQLRLTSARLGRIERAIVDELRRTGDVTSRGDLLEAVFPSVGGPPIEALRRPDAGRARARAEATLSRALASLERKGFLLRERNERTGRTLLRPAGVHGVAEWEQFTRAEEDLAAHCRMMSRRWDELRARAHLRANRIRTERSTQSTEAERIADLELIAQLEPTDD